MEINPSIIVSIAWMKCLERLLASIMFLHYIIKISVEKNNWTHHVNFV